MDLEIFSETTAFRQVVRTITALSTQDERIAEEFRTIAGGYISRGRIVEIEIDVPVGLRVDLGAFADSIWAKVWDRVGRANWRPFEEARAFTRTLGLTSVDEYRRLKQALPPDIPAHPEFVYAKQGWVNWADWLGTDLRVKPVFQSFEDARPFARNLGLRSKKEWDAYSKSGLRPPDIPSNPHVVYRSKGWINYGDWLGTGHMAPRFRRYRSFEEGRVYARGLGLKSRAAWNAFAKSRQLPPDIPACPHQIYARKGWAGCGDWLGTGTVATRLRRYRPFEEGRIYARSRGLKSRAEWNVFAKSRELPTDIPACPHQTYAGKGWAGYVDWLGTSAK
jgi:hypothetical protein